MEDYYYGMYVVYRFIRQDVLYAAFRPDVTEVTLAMVRQAPAERLSLHEGRKVFLVMEALGNITFSAEALRFLVGPEGLTGLLAVAIICTYPVTLASLFYVQGEIPATALTTRLVASVAEALRWFDSINPQNGGYAAG